MNITSNFKNVKKTMAFKYIISFILIIGIPMLIVNYISYKMYTNIILKNSSDRILNDIEQTSDVIDNEISRISYTTATVSVDEGITNLVNDWYKENDPYTKVNISSQIDSKLRYLFNYSNRVESMIFFFKDSGYYFYNIQPSIDEKKIRAFKWYTDALKHKGSVTVLGNLNEAVEKNINKNVISISICPLKNQVEQIYFAYKTEVFSEIYRRSKIKNIGETIICDQHGNVIVSTEDKQMVKNQNSIFYSKLQDSTINNSYIKYINNQKSLVTVYTSPNTGWKIINYIDYASLSQDVKKWSIYNFIFFSTIAITFVLFSIYFFSLIINPLKLLMGKMKKVKGGDFDISVYLKGSIELNYLGEYFNIMMSEIKKLTKEKEFEERERSRSELEALQAQINPHFIANTLNSIRLMALIAKVDNIRDMSEAFMKLLADTIGRGGIYNDLSTEINILKNYIYIMKIRFGDKFNITFDIDENVEELHILKMLLQPILENAILHGVNELLYKGEIKIIAVIVMDKLSISIYDNGVGISEEGIKQLLQAKHTKTIGFNRIGLRNVNERIKLNYGNDYGININSVIGEFTCITMTLPIISDIEEK